MSNYLLEKNMSLKAKGLLSLMLSLPNGCDYGMDELIATFKENKTAVKSAIKELETFRYLKITKTRNEKGQIEYIYDVFEYPYKN